MTEPSSSCSSAPSAAHAKNATNQLSSGAMGFRMVKTREQLVLLLAGGGEVAGLHMAEAADVFRNARDLYRQLVIGGRELGEQALDVHLVFHDQRAFRAPLRGVTERIERRTAQAAQALQETEYRQHPGAEAHLARLAGRWIFACKERRSQVKHQAVIAFEHAGDLLLERAIGVQAGDLVFVLVGEQLGVVAGNSFG